MLMFNLILSKEFNYQNNETKFKVCGECNVSNNTILEQGLICCNSNFFDEFCYITQCLQPKKIWLCYQSGFFGVFMIRHFPSLISMIFAAIIRRYLDGSTLEKYMSFYVFVFIIDFIISFIIIGAFCHTFDLRKNIFEIALVLFLCLLLPFYVFITSDSCVILTTYGWVFMIDFDMLFKFDDMYRVMDFRHLPGYPSTKLQIIGTILHNFAVFIGIIFGYILVIDLYLYIFSTEYHSI